MSAQRDDHPELNAAPSAGAREDLARSRTDARVINVAEVGHSAKGLDPEESAKGELGEKREDGSVPRLAVRALMARASQDSSVLAQRVIALGVPEDTTSQARVSAPAPVPAESQPTRKPSISEPGAGRVKTCTAVVGQPATSDPAASQRSMPSAGGQEAAPSAAFTDLSATVLEWGGRHLGSALQASQAARSSGDAVRPVPSVRNLAESVEAEWATHSSISIELCEEPEVWRRIRHISLEDAVTVRFKPTGASPLAVPSGAASEPAALGSAARGSASSASEPPSITAGLVAGERHEQCVQYLRAPRVEQAAGTAEPQRSALHYAIVWTAVAGFALSLLLMAYSIASFFVCGELSCIGTAQ